MEGSAVFGPPVTKDGKLIGGEIGTREAEPHDRRETDILFFASIDRAGDWSTPLPAEQFS